MKSLISLWSVTANELAVRCCTSALRDIKTVTERSEHEGLWFLAVTLADLGKATQKWLDQGFVVPSDCPDFARSPGGRTSPRFLGGFYGRVFDPFSGALLDEPDVEAIYALCQLTLMFSKIALPEKPVKGSSRGSDRKVVSPRQERLAMSDFIQCEQDVKASDERLDPSDMEDFKRMSKMLFGDLFAKMDRDVRYGRIVMKHGPGAVADRRRSNAKYLQRTWPARLGKMFPPEEHLVVNQKPEMLSELHEDLHILEPGAEIPVRVITVPKTIKTPRIIAIEPTAMQYAQQGLLRSFLSSWREDGFLSQVIGITDQDPNRDMARTGSSSGDLATLDLSEASDRVSNQHVRAMLDDFPDLLWAVDSARSRKADVPGHGVIRLAKFASMGSALCFPFEAMVFLTIIFLGIERELSAPLSRRTLIRRFDKQVRVFGDDLIVPRDYVLSVCDTLELLGFKVNIGKSFWAGRFRESCGRMYYDGQDISVVKVRQLLPTTRQDASGVISAVAFRNLCYTHGLWKTAAWLDVRLKGLLKFFPNVALSSPLLGRKSFLGYEYQGLSEDVHSPLTRGWYMHSIPPRDKLEGYGALLKCLGTEPTWHPFGLEPEGYREASVFDIANVDDEHLERSGRPKHVNIKLGRRSPF
jgi:hypothetical protein